MTGWKTSNEARLQRGLDRARGRDDFKAIDDLLAPAVEAAAAGDNAALGFLLRQIDALGLVQAPIRKLLIDEGDVEDAHQTTLIAVTRAIDGFEGRARFTTWLWKIAEREALQVLRRNKRVAEPDGEDLSGLAEEVRRMSSIVAGRDAIRVALDRLDDKLRVPVMLRDIDGLDYQAIADQLDIPLGTVKTRIRNGRAALAEAVIAGARDGSIILR